MPTECCVPLCKRKGGHAFPFSRPDIFTAWKIAIKRDKWQPTKHSVVCRSHFDENDYLERTTCGTTPLQKRLKAEAVPHIFQWSKTPSEKSVARESRMFKRRKLSLEFNSPSGANDPNAFELVGANEEVSEEPQQNAADSSHNEKEDKSFNDAKIQTDVEAVFRARAFMFDAARMHYYTGLENYEKFSLVLSTLGPAANHLNYFYGWNPSLSIEDQFFLTLMKLRRHTPNIELSWLFRTSETGVMNIFITWVNFMACEWEEVDWWPSRELVRFYSPESFKDNFVNTRLIIDGTECPMQKPKDPLKQQATFSTYKNINTVKVLVGMTPGGLVSYVSPAYGGSASDRQIVERSDLIKMCDPGDSIMADKGFNVQDLFVGSGVHINHPEFFKKKNRISHQTVLKDRKIASKRVHIERIIGLGKTFKILKSPLNRTEAGLATRIIQVCFYLCNFRNNIVPHDA